MSSVLAALMAIAFPLAGCRPPADSAISSEAELDVIRINAREIHLKLRNRTSRQVVFWGARNWWWEDVFPQGPQFECILANPGQMHESPYPLIDGPEWKQFVVEPGHEIGIVVGKSFLEGSDGKHPSGRCRFVLHLEGDAVLKSEEFESRQ